EFLVRRIDCLQSSRRQPCARDLCGFDELQAQRLLQACPRRNGFGDYVNAFWLLLRQRPLIRPHGVQQDERSTDEGQQNGSTDCKNSFTHVRWFLLGLNQQEQSSTPRSHYPRREVGSALLLGRFLQRTIPRNSDPGWSRSSRGPNLHSRCHFRRAG